jgi:hypothetical protein
MKKSRIEKLIPIANQALLAQYGEMLNNRDEAILRKQNPNDPFYIKSNYDGKVSGFGITVALSGLRPALAMYFNESGDIKTRPILETLAKIIVVDEEYNNEISKDSLKLNAATARDLIDLAIKMSDELLPVLKKYVLEATTALKQVIRTYELVKN